MFHARTARRRPLTPRFENLEGRALTAVQITESAGVLSIVGDSRNNTVVVYDGEDVPGGYKPARIQIQYDGKTYAPRGVVRDIKVSLGGGNDAFSYYLGDSEPSPYGLPDSRRTLRVSMGAGNDRVYAQLSGFGYGNGNDPSSLGPGKWDLRFDLGAGNDRFKLDHYASLLGTAQQGTVSANDVYIAVTGGAGNDRLEANFARLSITNSYYDVVMNGGAGNDVETMTTYGLVTVTDSTVHLDRYGNGGNDRMLGTFDYQLVGNTIFEHVLDTGSGYAQMKVNFRGRTRR